MSGLIRQQQLPPCLWLSSALQGKPTRHTTLCNKSTMGEIFLHFTVVDKHTRGPNQQTIITRDEELRFINVFAGEARSGLERRDSQNRKSNLPWLGLEISLPSRKWGKYLSTDLMILDTKIKTQQRTGQLTANSKRFLHFSSEWDLINDRPHREFKNRK